MRMKKKKKFSALFLDRDGVLNYKREGYIKSFSDFVFIDQVKESISQLNYLFHRIIIVTNQQGIGKKLMTIQDLHLLHSLMNAEIENAGGKIDKIYFCPHLASDNCECRKPKPGMLLQSKEDFRDIDFQKSILAGDSDSDILAAKSLNIKSIKISSEYTLSDWTKKILID